MTAEKNKELNMEEQPVSRRPKEPLSILDAIYARRSVRQFLDDPVEEDAAAELNTAIESCNVGGNIHMQAIYEDRSVFDCNLARMAHFKNVKNYILLSGVPEQDLEERCGYFGEMIVMKLVQLGLSCCWVGGSYNKKAAASMVPKGEKLVAAIAFGYGAEPGVPHGGKFLDEVIEVQSRESIPAWFKVGAEAALLAPTAMGRQNYKLILKDGEASLKMTRKNTFTKLDRGILKCHFEMASAHKIS